MNRFRSLSAAAVGVAIATGDINAPGPDRVDNLLNVHIEPI
jgi:hypothetical protein